jgi:ribosome biogenesis protein MAK21
MTLQGDTDKSVASKASHHVLVLLQTHPAMKAVIVREVASLVLKAPTVAPIDHKRRGGDGDKKGKGKGKAVPHANEAGANHGRYYGLITLNQVTLTIRDRDVAARLVEVYFEIFRELLDTDMDPPAPTDPEEADQQNLEKITGKVSKWQGRRKGTKFTKGKGQQHEEEIEQGDSKMISAVLTGVNRAMPFAKLDDTMWVKLG